MNEDLKFEDFKKNPILYILFLPLVALIYFQITNKNISDERINSCEKEKIELKTQIQAISKENKDLVKLLIQKQTLDSLRK